MRTLGPPDSSASGASGRNIAQPGASRTISLLSNPDALERATNDQKVVLLRGNVKASLHVHRQRAHVLRPDPPCRIDLALPRVRLSGLHASRAQVLERCVQELRRDSLSALVGCHDKADDRADVREAIARNGNELWLRCCVAPTDDTTEAIGGEPV